MMNRKRQMMREDSLLSSKRVDRRTVLKGGLAMGAMMLTDAASAVQGTKSSSDAVDTTEPLNILMIVVDQERGWYWLPDTLPFEEYMPARAWLRSQGVYFKNYHVHTNPCSPSRSTILTGRHTSGTRIFENINVPVQGSMSPSIPTIGGILSAGLGYYTAYIGKWHLTKDADFIVDSNGLPSLESYGFRDWGGADFEGIAGTEGLDHDGELCDQAITWLNNHRDDTTPWCLTVCLINPHDIAAYPSVTVNAPDYGLELPRNHWDSLATKPTAQIYWQKFYNYFKGRIPAEDSDTWRLLLNNYLYYHIQVDIQINRILSALDSDLLARTVVVFTSDHGELGGAHMLRAKGPTVYRESQNVPLIVIDPRLTAENRGIETVALAGGIDLAPTLVEIAGGKPSSFNLKERSLMPILSRENPADAPLRAVREGILFTYDAWQGSPTLRSQGHLRGIYNGQYKFARYYAVGHINDPLSEQQLELYDINGFRADGHDELKNRAYDPEYEDVVTEMNALMGAMIEDEDAQGDQYEDLAKRAR